MFLNGVLANCDNLENDEFQLLLVCRDWYCTRKLIKGIIWSGVFKIILLHFYSA